MADVGCAMSDVADSHAGLRNRMPTLPQHPTSDIAHPTSGSAYWRSLDDLADTPEFRAFVQQEFPSYDPDEVLAGPSRRQFLKIMGASFALAGLAAMPGCRRWPREEIVPYANRPEYSVPGDKEFFATTMELGGVAKPLLVTCVDGRPVKVEGNPDHPASGGTADLYAQASILDLYDPHRPRKVMHDGKSSSWAAFDQWWGDHAKELAASEGKGLVVLSELTSSPTVARLQAKLLKQYPQAQWVTHEPVNRNHEIDGTKLAFGKSVRPVYDLSKADVIVSLDSDFLMRHPYSLRLAKQFADGRRLNGPKDKMNRLYVVEPTFTATGTMADERHALDMVGIAQLTEKLAVGSGVIGGHEPHDDSPVSKLAADIIADLEAHGRNAVIVAGEGQPAEVHALVAGINVMRGYVGNTVRYIADNTPMSVDQLPEVDTLVIFGGDPAYTGVRNFSAKHIVHLTQHDNQTSGNKDFRGWKLPRAHFAEAWGDALTWDGTITLQQPLIRPLFGGRSSIELLQVMAGEKPDGAAALRETHNTTASDKSWRKAIHDGFVADSTASNARVSTTSGLRGVKAKPANLSRVGDWQAIVRPDYALYDGRFANNGWLQELPDPITKLTWDNAALLSHADCEKLNLKLGSLLNIAGEDVPVYPMPGQADGMIVLAMGYGRKVVGPVGEGVGFDALRVASGGGEGPVLTGKEYKLATTQEHHSIDVRQLANGDKKIGELIREATLDEYHHHPNFAQHVGPHVPSDSEGIPLQQWEPPVDFDEAADQQWGMAVDLTSCTGCNACVVACQAENNIPIVGKEEVARGREMHWIRIDRYFKGSPEGANDIQAVHQPVMCQHCENAPCEQVCPVAATVHDSEGLNVMVYNRCIGTRYCSNNCPYKVRRFNYFDYHSKPPYAPAKPWNNFPDNQQEHQVDKITRMQFNPQVTVRMRGVMEKCTFCTQRLQEAKISAKVDGRVLKDGDVTPACAQTCPTQAIVFGNLNDPNSRVRQLHEKNQRSYGILNELNTRPRTKYLARVRNPNEKTKAGSSKHEEHGHH